MIPVPYTASTAVFQGLKYKKKRQMEALARKNGEEIPKQLHNGGVRKVSHCVRRNFATKVKFYMREFC